MPGEVKVGVETLAPEFVRALETAGVSMKTFPHMLSALNKISHLYRQTWVSYAQGAEIPGTPRRINSGAGGYAGTIQVDNTGEEVKYVFSDSPHHGYIERGHGEIDLKPGLLSGPKARLGEGGPYNIVAFRHGTPGTQRNPMPIQVYQLMRQETQKAVDARKTAISKVTKTRGGRTVLRASAQSARGFAGWATRQLNEYKWGARLPKGVGKRYEGMVRMQMQTGAAKRTGYITFRVVSIRSPARSWIVPPLQGIPIRDIVVKQMYGVAADIIREALEEDLR